MQNKNIVKSEYEIQAETFLKENGLTFKAVFAFHGPHWEGDKETRNVWDLTIERFQVDKPIERFTVRFGQSIADSFLYPSENGALTLVPYNDRRKDRRANWCEKYKQPTKRNIPTTYDLLACITKYDPGTFENFCSEFDYDTDSRKAEKTYFAVQKEWEQVRRFFTQAQLEAIQDIN